MSEPLILGVEDADPEPMAIPTDGAPKRRRGRPPGSKNTGSRTSSARRNSRTWVCQQTAIIIGAVNIALVTFPQTREDALDDEEMDLLADAVTAEAMANERILKWIERAGVISPHLLMIRALFRIGIPRLQRHGILPTPKLTDEQKAEARRMYRDAGVTIPPEFEETPVPVEAGRTSNDNGQHW